MYSRSDSAESTKLTQWGLNPSNYQNMANDQVDWAALAQQWIIMKDADPPPIPGEHPVELKHKKDTPRNEGGEAPMDMDDKDEPPAWAGPPPQLPPGCDSWNWNAQNQQWGWNNTWVPPSGVPPNPAMMKPPLLPTPNNFEYNRSESSSDSFGGPTANNEYAPVYWTGSSNKIVKPHNRRYSKVNVPRVVPAGQTIPPHPISPHPVAPHPVRPIVPEPPVITTPTLDAAKRKQLPAWIREGLEKMERDKIKQQEKEREKIQQEQYHEKIKQNEKEKLEILKDTMKEQQKSKFDTDGEDSDATPPNYRQKRASPEAPVPLSAEELMMKVRRTMTEILLNVTNKHIETICKEEHQRYLKKAKASDQRAPASSGANLRAKLGLGLYGYGSESSSSEDSDDDNDGDKKDSDDELKNLIKRKLTDFSKTEREIEDKLADAESRKAEQRSRSSSPETIDNDSQVDARLLGRNLSPEGTPPSSKTIEPKSSKRSETSSSEEGYLEKRSYKPSRRSSFSESDDSSTRSRTKSRTPEKSYSSSYKTSSKYSSSSKVKSTPSSQRSERSSSVSRKRRSRSDSRDRNGSRRRSKRSRSRSYSSRRSRSNSSRANSYKRSKRSRSRRRSRSRSLSKSSSKYSSSKYSTSRYSSSRRSRSRDRKRRRSRSLSSGRGKRSSHRR